MEKNVVYLLVEDDDSCDVVYRIFKTVEAATAAFKKTLTEYCEDNSLTDADFEALNITFDRCVESGGFCDDGYYLVIFEREIEE